jgi:tRNA-specific 2-thiouridylase
MTKTEVRVRARELGLANADKPESQEICFVPDGDYAGLVERATSRQHIRPGQIVDRAGTRLAAHRGVHHFTIGQRRGLGFAAGEPMYVREIHGDTGTVVVGRREELSSAGLLARDVSLVDASRTTGRLEVEVKTRYRQNSVPALLALGVEGRAEVRFLARGPAVTPGQACVFYRGEEVLGGGFIERALEA